MHYILGSLYNVAWSSFHTMWTKRPHRTICLRTIYIGVLIYTSILYLCDLLVLVLWHRTKILSIFPAIKLTMVHALYIIGSWYTVAWSSCHKMRTKKSHRTMCLRTICILIYWYTHILDPYGLSVLVLWHRTKSLPIDKYPVIEDIMVHALCIRLFL